MKDDLGLGSFGSQARMLAGLVRKNTEGVREDCKEYVDEGLGLKAWPYRLGVAIAGFMRGTVTADELRDVYSVSMLLYANTLVSLSREDAKRVHRALQGKE